MISSQDDVACVIQQFVDMKVTPILEISSVTGHNIQLLLKMLNLLPVPIHSSDYHNEELEVHIEEVFYVAGRLCGRGNGGGGGGQGRREAIAHTPPTKMWALSSGE